MISHPCVSLPQMLLKPMEYYTFWVVLGAMGSLFEKKLVFFEIHAKMQKFQESWNFQICGENGNFDMVTYASLVDFDLENGDVTLKYRLVIKGLSESTNTLKIKISESA